MLAALVLALAPQDLVQISGRVLLADGSPLAGAALLVTPADGPDAWPYTRLDTSAPDGSFRFEISPDALRRLPLLVALSEAGVGVAALEAGGPLEIEVAPARPLVLTLVDGERVLAQRKVRLHPVETALHGADVTRPEFWSDKPARGLLERLLIATTDARGVALFPHLPAGPAFGEWRVLLGPHAIPLFLSERGDEGARVDLASRTTATLHGRLTDERGRPVQGAEVSARWWRLEGLDSPDLPRCTSDAEGRYRLEGVGLERDQACLRVLHDGYLPALERPRRIFEGPLVEWDVTLWRLAPIRGRVVGPGQTPIAGIAVEAHRPDSRRVEARAVSDAGGTFALEPLVAGPYRLVVSDPDGGLPHEVFAAAGEEDLVVPLLARAADPGPTQPPGIGSLIVDFVEEGGVEPVHPDFVQLAGSGGAAIWSETGGSRATFRALPRGEWVLIVAGEGLQPEHVPVTVGSAPLRLVVELHYPVTARVAGRVAFPQGLARPDSWVRAEWSPGDPALGAQHFPWVRVGPAGRFELGTIYEGAVTLHLTAIGWAGETRIELGPLGDEAVELVARPVAELEFVPVDYTPSARFVLELAADGEPWRRVAERAVSDGHQDLFLVTVAPGEWRWRVRIERGAPGTRNLELLDLPTGRVTAVPGQRVRVQVPVDLPRFPRRR